MALKETSVRLFNRLAAGISMRLEGVTEAQVNFAMADPEMKHELTRIFGIQDLGRRSSEFYRYFTSLNTAHQIAINRMFVSPLSKRGK